MSTPTCQIRPLLEVLDALLHYANQHLHVVRDTPDPTDYEREQRRELLQRHLWRHRELIEAYLRAQGDTLDQAARSWLHSLAHTLYDTFYLSWQPDGTLLAYHDTGVYVPRPFCDLPLPERRDGPLQVRVALIPWQEGIVMLPPIPVTGRHEADALHRLCADLARKGLERPVRDPQVLAQRADAFLPEAVQKRTATGNPEAVGPGYHRGALAGLSRAARAKACADQAVRSEGATGLLERIEDLVSIEATGVPASLEEALLLLDTDWLADIALQFADDPLPQLSRTRLATFVCQQVAERPEALSAALMWCLDEQFELMERLFDTNPLPLDALERALRRRLYPMPPYLFILREGPRTSAWMPPQVHAQLDHEAFALFRSLRQKLAEIRNVARGLATMCGIISVADAYARYCRAVAEPVDRASFEQVLEELEACEARDDYALWHHQDTSYLISVEISDKSALARVVRESYTDHIFDEAASGLPDDPIYVGLSREDEAEFSHRVQETEAALEQARLSLLACEHPLPAHDLLPGMLVATPIEALMELPALAALRSYVDAHVPDDEDDYAFGDLFTRSMVVSSVLMNEDYAQAMDLIRLYHMGACEGTAFSHTLGRLVTNAYNALPRWQLGGWSLEELTERATGRRRFFAADGTERTVDAREPCPCGSGRAYADCCGSLS